MAPEVGQSARRAARPCGSGTVERAESAHRKRRRDVPRLASYVADRHSFLDRIVKWYGLPDRDFAKTALLVVVNNGELRYWRRKVKSPVSPFKPELSELVELQREVLRLRGLVCR